MLIAWVPLLIALKDIKPRNWFRFGFFQGMITYSISLFWFYHIFRAGAVCLFMILALFTGIFSIIYGSTRSKIKNPFLDILFVACVWTSIEFFRSEIYFLKFPWITTGSAIGVTYLTPVIGVYGISFLIYTASLSMVRKKTIGYGAILSIILLLLGIFRPAPVAQSNNRAITALAVQGDCLDIKQYLSLSDKISNGNPHIIVWPEYAVPYDIRKKSPEQLKEIISFAQKNNATIIFGTQTITGLGIRDWKNTALIIDKTGIIGEYVKNRPVHFMNDGLAGKEAKPIATSLGTIGTPICFDCDYSDVARKMVEQGAELFTVPSYDAAHWSEVQHVQHADLFKLRASETGRWIIVATGSSVSQIIDPHGKIHASLKSFEEGTICSVVELRNNKTVYVRFGWILPWLCIVYSYLFPAVYFFIKLRSTR
jgi:apolipoprotein N-acyltransferase